MVQNASSLHLSECSCSNIEAVWYSMVQCASSLHLSECSGSNIEAEWYSVLAPCICLSVVVAI